ncbi:oxidoreductase [Mycolicibacterium conceptionense]|uniref:Oxidoreductase n=2 Tax=Mycobacteriaceae TaxID=1762 RepID=A0A0U1CVT9_9MYCO|nr:oxidoreductase [Mycolicibacterium conceptionense]
MSPVGGVGINVAIQDAAAAARLLYQPLREHRVTESDLAAVQRRRALPTTVTQGLQRILHRQVMAPVMAGADITPPGALVRIVRRLPQLTAFPAYLVGTGVRPEHVPLPARR